jgi:hypothetical protein
MKKFNKETKTYRLFQVLQSGERVTPSVAKNRLGIKNLSAEVSRVREHGFAVYRKSYKAGNGVQTTFYVLGTPSQEIVALGYKAKRLGITL